jgi:hypothetical protein
MPFGADERRAEGKSEHHDRCAGSAEDIAQRRQVEPRIDEQVVRGDDALLRIAGLSQAVLVSRGSLGKGPRAGAGDVAIREDKREHPAREDREKEEDAEDPDGATREEPSDLEAEETLHAGTWSLERSMGSLVSSRKTLSRSASSGRSSDR